MNARGFFELFLFVFVWGIILGALLQGALLGTFHSLILLFFIFVMCLYSFFIVMGDCKRSVY